MISRRVLARSANWEYLSSTIGKDVNITSFREACEKMESDIVDSPKKVTGIDYKAWEAKVGKEAVAAIKDDFENVWLKVKKPETTMTFDEGDVASLRADAKSLVEDCQKMEDWHRLRVRELEIEIGKLQYELDNLDDLHVDDMMKRYPHIAERVDAQIEEGVPPGYKE
eukprot:CAMPEP_0197523786 /NCGR_PEP_ID=MMETSP1318-20131121/8650_1 /TAXON_ID=552666 /ORGANISM="Partenskyella glossopodia, Strain RCC365" /LENGTH=167 /DNA_ID=CAMNT_0043076585 /DNA_START=99 /DNA_END=602 /DNA_ORIENTATION=+